MADVQINLMLISFAGFAGKIAFGNFSMKRNMYIIKLYSP